MYWVMLLILLALTGVGTPPIVGLLLFGLVGFMLIFKVAHCLSWRRIDAKWPWTPQDVERRSRRLREHAHL
jgi:hypothetical protein